MTTQKTITKRYRFPIEMVDALEELKTEEAVNESAFVRLAIANELAKRGVIVDHFVERGGFRPRKNQPTETK